MHEGWKRFGNRWVSQFKIVIVLKIEIDDLLLRYSMSYQPVTINLHNGRFTPADGFDALENVNSPKVVVNKEMKALYFSRSIIPYQRNRDKKEWLAGHTYYKHIGLYAYRAPVLKEITSLPQSSLELAESLEQLRWLENGYSIKVGISEVETIGIDTPQDLARAEEFLRNQQEAL